MYQWQQHIIVVTRKHILVFFLIIKIIGRKEMFSFNDAFNTFYLCLCGTGHIAKDQSNSESETPLPSIHGFFYMHHLKDKLVYTTAFATPVVEHWLEQGQFEILISGSLRYLFENHVSDADIPLIKNVLSRSLKKYIITSLTYCEGQQR